MLTNVLVSVNIYLKELMLMKHITNYKPKDFARLLGDEEIAKSIQSGDKTHTTTDTKD